jgi:hypothetical protein
MMVLFFVLAASQVFGQEVRTLDGTKYTVIEPKTYAFNADSGTIKVGQKYVIDDSVMSINGAKLALMNTGIMNGFTLAAPVKYELGTKVRVYAEITKVNTSIMNYVEAKVIKLEGPSGSGQVNSTSANRTLDGVQYKVISPEEYAFNADNTSLKVGEKYVIDDSVMSIDGAKLVLMNTGIMNGFTLSAPSNLGLGANVRVYVEITKVNTAIIKYAEAKVIKLERR